ncbi:MAG: hypothetical protein KDA88_12440 [Planctomycetaceae bacterium]|nr:hypothetical protein [Planctomycetaceae bacterium]MCB9952037.1 hypothetical protein [Planctomycetaceae bacterium]
MSHPKTSIVVTTIFEPDFLQGYLSEIELAGQRDNVAMYVIADKKTPATVAAACAAAREQGYQIHCPTLDEQDAYLKKLDLPAELIPWNTDNRRNIGYLMAIESGCDVLISIDDDNFTLPETNFLAGHQVVGKPAADPVTTSSDGWFNICNLIDGWGGGEIFARGFPYYAQRNDRTLNMSEAGESITVAMNAGLWLDEPDVDAVYRLCRRAKGTEFTGPNVVLSADTWSPVNTQNTALMREAALTYYYVKMGFPLKGLTIDRFGDILSGYLTQKCMKHLGYGVRLGSPVVDHRRTPHNLFKDLYHELAGIVLIEEFLPWLVEAKLDGTNGLDAYQSLAEQMHAAADQFTGFIWDDGGREFLRATSANMQTWVNCVRRFA